MHRTKHGIARTGICRVTADHLVPANDSTPHDLNLDAAQRELDRRAAEGEDVSGLRINPTTYAIERAPEQQASVAAFFGLQPYPERQACWACGGTGKVTTSSNGSGLIEAPCANCASEEAALEADLARDADKGAKLAARNDATAFALQLDPGFRELGPLTQEDRNLAAAWSGLERSDLDLPK